MARRWTVAEETYYRTELEELYVRQNKTIGEIATLLGMAPSGVFRRLQRLGIPSVPERKPGYLKTLKDVFIPQERSAMLSEFFGIMLGDGHVSRFQTIVTLGTKELPYVKYVSKLMSTIFMTPATIHIRKDGYRDVYIGSIRLTEWLRHEGLVLTKSRHK